MICFTIKDDLGMPKKEICFKNRDRFIQLWITISALRKLRGMSQEQLAEKANISRSHLSAIEAPEMVRALSMDTFYNIADALEIDPAELVRLSTTFDHVHLRSEQNTDC